MRKTLNKSKHSLAISLIIFIMSFSFEGCSSVHVVAKQASKADDIHEKTVWALWWGASDPLENIDCQGNGLQIVSYKTSWIYSLCSFVTFGAVVPMDVEYRCTSAPMQGGGEIGMIEKGETNE